MNSEQPSPSKKAAERLAVIVDAAERAALSVIDDAEQEAKRYLEEAQARADRIVAERLREAADRLEAQGGPPEALLRPVEPDEEPELEAPVAEPEPPPPPRIVEEPEEREQGQDEEPPTPVPEPAPEPSPIGEGRSGRGSAAARLLATQMAVSGSTRKEIEMRLRNGFEIEDAGEILDAILGPEE